MAQNNDFLAFFDRFPDEKSMRIYFLTAFILLSGISYGQQEDSLIQDRQGKGNSSFILTINSLEILKSRTTLRQLEQKLGVWQTANYANNRSLEWNDKTQDHDIPHYEISYKTTIGGKYYTIMVDTKGKPRYTIQKLVVTAELNGMSLAEFKKSLQDRGYLVNENLTEIFHRQTWQSRTKGFTVIVSRDGSGTCSIEIF